MKCIRPECDNELNTGRRYCSTRCAAIDRKRAKEERVAVKQSPSISPDVVAMLQSRLGEDAGIVLREMDKVLLEAGTEVPPLFGLSERDYDITGVNFGFGDTRPSDALDYEIIDQMMRCGPVIFVIEMKKSAMAAAFRNEQSVRVISPDKELEKVVQANLVSILPLMASEFLNDALYYGACFMEVIWKYQTSYELGLTKSRGASRTWATIDLPYGVKPSSVTSILRTMNGDFNGFVQRSKTGKDITIGRDRALVTTHDKHWGNLWGESALKPMYPIWFWYEVVLRALVRYTERMGTPVAVCEAPSRAKVIQPGTTTQVSAMQWGLMVAASIAKSNAVVIPSDRDPENGQPLWNLRYLVADDRASVFVTALEFLTQVMVRAGLTADRATTQSSGGTGSYAIGYIHNAATMLHNEMVLTSMEEQLNRYLMPRFSLYNRGQNGPPIWLEIQGLDPAEQERLFRLIGIAGNKIDSTALDHIDWRKLYRMENVPILSEEEMEAQLKEKEKKAADALKAQQKAMKQQVPPKPSANGNEEEGEDEGSVEENATNSNQRAVGQGARR